MGSKAVIEHYTAKRIPNPYPAGDLTWQIYHTVRNAFFRCCHKFGRAGPMGTCPITDDAEIPHDDWHVADRDALDFFVVDDQYNDERYIYVEVVRATSFTERWLCALMRTLADYPGWGVGIEGLPKAYILAFADKLMVTGRIFQKCRDFECIVRQGQAALSRRRRSKSAR